jgi:RNA polymerase-binding transcription factor DksA
VVKNLREELEACQEHLAQKKELLAEALTQLKVFLKDEEMLESEIGENERLAQEVEDFKYDLEQSERARKWLAQRLSATGFCWSIFFYRLYFEKFT